MGNNLTDTENAALVMWTSSDHSQAAFMTALRHAIGLTEDRLNRSEDHRLAFLEEELRAVKDLAYRGTGSPRDAVEAIFERASKALGCTR